MALIDKDQAKAEIRRRLSLIYLLEGDFTDGSRDAYEGLLSWLDTLPEQPVIKKSNALFDKCVKNCDPAVMKEVSDNVDKMLGKQPVEGLEKEIERFYRTDEYKIADNLGRGFETIARHFYEFGCRRTAVMYDDIEYERQRAEEAELSEDLEEEIDKYFQGWINDLECGDALTADYTGVDVDKCKEIARHFAEWGAEHGKK